MKLTSLAAATLLVLAACSNGEDKPLEQTDSQTGTQTETTTEQSTAEQEDGVGADTVIQIGQESADEVAYLIVAEPLLFRTEAEWTDWYERAVPKQLRELDSSMREPTFDGTVAVAGNYFRCTEYSYLDAEDGELSFHIATPESEEEVLCYWSPNQFVVHEVSLDTLGVADAADVTIDPDYVRG